MISRLPMLLIFLAVSILVGTSARATDPATVEAAVGAADAAPGLFKAARSVARIPLEASQIVRLPMGVLEIILSPMPGITAKQGTEDLGQGLLAPFKLTMSVLEVPYHVLGGLEQAAVKLVD